MWTDRLYFERKIVWKANTECFVLFLLVIFYFFFYLRRRNCCKAGGCDNMQNAKTCIFNYSKDLQIKVFYTFTVVQNIFFFLRKFNFARKMEWKWLRQTIARTSKEKEVFNSRSNFVWHCGELKHVQGTEFINLSPMTIVL